MPLPRKITIQLFGNSGRLLENLTVDEKEEIQPTVDKLRGLGIYKNGGTVKIWYKNSYLKQFPLNNMIITFSNYKTALPKEKWEQFEKMANTMFAKGDTRTVYYENGNLVKKLD